MVDAKQNVIDTEREAKKALLKEKERLEKEINRIKRDKEKIFNSNTENSADRRASQKNDESMSLYFAKSHAPTASPIIDPETKLKNSLSKQSSVSQSQRFFFKGNVPSTVGTSELKKEKVTSSSFDNMPSTIQIDEIDRSNSDPVSIPIVQKNFVSPVKHLQRAKVPKLTTHDLMKHPSLGSD